jgi:hypothetical protein
LTRKVIPPNTKPVPSKTGVGVTSFHQESQAEKGTLNFNHSSATVEEGAMASKKVASISAEDRGFACWKNKVRVGFVYFFFWSQGFSK